MLSSVLGILYFIIAISIIVIVHEYGHMRVAKRNGVKCFEFAIGMGPVIKKLGVDKDGTIYNLRAVPIGGFVMMAGEEEAQEMEFDKEESLSNKKPWQKIKILFAGAGMNFVLGFVVFFIMFFFLGVEEPINTNEILVAPNSPAMSAGIVTGDEITAIDGKNVSNYEDIKVALEVDRAVDVTYLHNNVSKTVNISPEKIDCENTLYGVSPKTEYKRFKLTSSIKNAAIGFAGIVGSIGESLRLLFNGTAGVGDLMGPIGIADASSNIVTSGLRMMLGTLAYLSINIGIVNLLPFPALDGGRMVFAFYELFTKRKVNEKFEMYLNAFGFMLLMGLFVVVTFSDVGRLGVNEYYEMSVDSDSVCARDVQSIDYTLNFEQISDDIPSAATLKLSLSDGVIESVSSNGESIDFGSDTAVIEYDTKEDITALSSSELKVKVKPNTSGTTPLDLTIKLYDENNDAVNQAIYRIER